MWFGVGTFGMQDDPIKGLGNCYRMRVHDTKCGDPYHGTKLERDIIAQAVNTDGDVANAPSFEHIAGDLLRAFSGSVIAAHNVYFDMGFLRDELSRLSVFRDVPHLCTRFMRPRPALLSKKGRPERTASSNSSPSSSLREPSG